MEKVITTPKGKAVYPKLDKPDTKFNEDGLWSCKIHVDEGAYNTFKLQVDEVVERAYQAECASHGKELPRSSNTPVRVTDEGDYEIYAKQVAKKNTRNGLLEFNVPLYDAKVQVLEERPKVASGSTVKMSVEIYPWYVSSQGFGYSLRLKAVQILDLIEYDSAVGGFSAEDGFVSESLDSALENETEKTNAPF